jgi:hypothetical protein
LSASFKEEEHPISSFLLKKVTSMGRRSLHIGGLTLMVIIPFSLSQNQSWFMLGKLPTT